MMPWYDGGVFGWGMAFMALSTLILLALLVVGIVALVYYTNRGTTSAGVTGAGRPPSTPQEILADRLARGEIDEDEYRRRLALLTGL